MSDEVDIICDRCGKTVRGIIVETHAGTMTGGFYDMGGWKEFSRGDQEKNVCDLCMWSDPKFLEIYPHVRQPSCK